MSNRLSAVAIFSIAMISVLLAAGAGPATGAGLAAGAGPAAGAAEGAALPSGAEVCDRYVEAVGGLAAVDGINNRISKMTAEFPAQGLKLDIIVYAARPDLFYSVIESPATGRIEKGVSAGVVWEKTLMSGPSVKDGAEKAMMLREATFEKQVYWRKVYKSAECTGVENIGGKDCYRVVMTVDGGDPTTCFFEKDSGLLARVESIVQSPMGAIPQVSKLSDWRPTGGILAPWRVDVEVMGQKRVITTTSIEQNVQMPEGIFDIPADIRALLEK